MKIYIASSWKNVHAVEMLTSILRSKGHKVLSFVEQENKGCIDNFDLWVQTSDAGRCFDFDTSSAMESDLVVYLGPSGKDAAAECGMAFAKGVMIVGLAAKGEDFGLMRKMMHCWCSNYRQLLDIIKQLESIDKKC